ncbi:MAG: PDZ domain-containing protein [Chitinophagaceae bacterium]|nr:PDZ domain-containing protein [Chitinophagaceae bacterium]
MRVLFIFLTLFTHTVWSQKIGFFLPQGKKSVSIPFELHSNLIVLKVLIADGEEKNFILDTGVKNIMVSDASLVQNLPVILGKHIYFFGVGRQDTLFARVISGFSFRIGDVEIWRSQALVLDQDYMNLNNHLGIHIHGIIGSDIFQYFVVDINYDQKILTLHNPKSYKKNFFYTSIPIYLENEKPHIETTITIGSKKQKASFMIDIGFNKQLLLENNNQYFTIPTDWMKDVVGTGFGGEIPGKIGRVKKIKWKHYRFKKSIASVPDYIDTSLSTKRKGLIGSEIMTHFNFAIDYAHKKLYLQKRTNPNYHTDYDMSGLSIIAIGETLNNYVVTNVREASPAKEAGIMIGDIITYINGVNLQNKNIEYINTLFRSQNKRKIILVLERKNQIIIKEFILKKIL